jgi:hypothetical protein
MNNPMSDSKEPDILKKSANYRVGKAIMSSIISSSKPTYQREEEGSNSNRSGLAKADSV